jgi:hypothetical protein
MNSGRAVFSQVMDHLPCHEFHRCVRRYGGERRHRGFSCMDQFLAMAFAQLTGRESLRDIEVCLRSLGPRLYHLGFRGRISRSTLADANEAHDWRIWADLAQALIAIARPLYAHEALDADLEATVYALDSSTIDLCLALFPWARFQRTKSAIKLHTLLDLRGSIPTFVRVTAGRRHDVQVLDEIVPEAGSFYVMDRGYLDFARLYVFVRCSAFYVVRCKKNVRLDRRYSHPAAIGEGVLSDHTVVLRTRESSRAYPEALRRVRFHDSTTGKQLVLLTNNFELEAVTIARLYKARWRVELFFKWIKQHLRVKAFYGLGENAVKTQIWIAIATYLLVAILKKRLGLEVSLYKLLQVLSITVFEKTPVLQAFQRTLYNLEPTAPSNQLKLLDL